MFVQPCRLMSSSAPKLTMYNPRIFREPVVDREEIKERLDMDDERNFLFLKAMKSDSTPVFFRDRTIDKLIRVCTKDGKKETSRKNVFAALEALKRKQYKSWMECKDREEKCLGGTTYEVPFPIEAKEAEFRAMKMMRDICRQRAKHGETHFREILASELLAAYQNEGLTIQAKQDLHKTCEANRAYAHYRS